MADANSLDQFYTRPELAQDLVSEVARRWHDPDVLFVEPSAGTGAFVKPLVSQGRQVYAMDLAPKAKGIIRGDFLQKDIPGLDDYARVVVIGNPPFGRNALLAVRFFNRAAGFADEISFIVPRTFRKLSIHRRLHKSFHLCKDTDIERLAFIFEGRPHDVPCAWQTWKRRKKERVDPEPPSIAHLLEFTNPRRADFAMRRVGFYAGTIITSNITSLSENSHYFIKEVKRGVMRALNQVDWLPLVCQTAGARSLSKAEIAFQLREAYHG